MDGKPREDGVRDFLASRNISLPQVDTGERPDVITAKSITELKNRILQGKLEREGIRVYPGPREYLKAVRRCGKAIVVVSSSANTVRVLQLTGLIELVDHLVDAQALARGGLRGKPAPDSYVEGARLAGASPKSTAVFEDALAGVTAGKAAGAGLVVGLNRKSAQHRLDLLKGGADRVVKDLGELL